MTRLLSFGVVLLASLTLVNSQRKLSEGAQKCFDQFMEGTIRRVKLGFCDVPRKSSIYYDKSLQDYILLFGTEMLSLL